MKKLKTNTQTKQRLVTLLILVLIMVILSCISNKYLTVNNLINIVRQESTLIIIACAATMLMISGGMDLSPAGVIALTSVVFAKLCVAGISIPLAALLSLLVGVARGTSQRAWHTRSATATRSCRGFPQTSGGSIAISGHSRSWW